MPLPQPVPDLVSLDLLRSVSELGSIRQAAFAHGISQPAASMRLKALERSFGLELLDRNGGHANLTPAGIAVVEWSAQVLGGVSDLLASTQALRREGRSNLRLAASMTVAEYLVPIWLSKLRSVDSAISVSLQMGNTEQILEVVRSQKADMGFVEGWSIPHEFRHTVVAADDLVVVVSPSHPWAHRKKIVTARELAATPLILREVGSGAREVLDKALEVQGFSSTAMVSLGSNTAIKAMVASGAGPGILARIITKAEVESGKLVEVTVRGISLGRSIRAIWNRGSSLPAPARRLLELIGDI